jgi:hypothetical protein
MGPPGRCSLEFGMKHTCCCRSEHALSMVRSGRCSRGGILGSRMTVHPPSLRRPRREYPTNRHALHFQQQIELLDRNPNAITAMAVRTQAR